MWTSQTLYRYQSMSWPQYAFYYRPMSRRDQHDRWRGHAAFKSPAEFFTKVFDDHVLLYAVARKGQSAKYHAWPSGSEAALAMLPRGIAVEVGAVIMGWMRDDAAEDVDAYILRLRRDMERILSE